MSKLGNKKQLSLFASLAKKLTSKKKLGNEAEQQACKHLQSHGLKLLDKNFSIKAGEVDLIMRDNETLVFVEVRYRKNADFGGAAASVTPKKQQRIIKASLAYQQKHAPQSSMRFDVVAIEGDNRELNWIRSAFDGF
jgi:putative endonuclease